jgi:hypothetical protein
MVVAVFQVATTYTLGNVMSTFFWTDNWLNGSRPMTLAPVVFDVVNFRKKKVMVAIAKKNKCEMISTSAQIPQPIHFCEIIFCQDRIISHRPQKNFYFSRNFAFPDSLMEQARIRFCQTIVD